MKKELVFEFWLESNRNWLEKCDGKTLGMTFSAGKDSSVCQYFLNEVKEQFNFKLKSYLCAYPRHRYSDEVNKKLQDYWASKGVDIYVQIPEEGDDLMENTKNPCRPCQNIRKSALPEIFSLMKTPVSDIVIVSGHSLWDIAAYALNANIAKELAIPNEDDETLTDKRLLEVSQRFYPFFTMPEGYSVYRPLLYLNQADIHQFCSEFSIPVIEEECRYSSWRPKNKLSEYFSMFGYNFEYEQVFNYAQKYLNIIPLDHIQTIKSKEYLSEHF